jgi:transcriptional regulator with XRE-family HTH domain
MARVVQQANDAADKSPGMGSDRRALGDEIRKLRKARGKSISEVAAAIGRSISFISQLERGNADASIADLRGIAQLFGVPLGWFFVSDTTPAVERGRVVRSGSRRQLGTVTSGKVEELLSPNIGGAFETFLDTFAPGAELPQETQRDTEEEGYVVKGVLDMWISGQYFQLNPGDSFRIVREPYRWANRGSEEVVAVWIIAPPTY